MAKTSASPANHNYMLTMVYRLKCQRIARARFPRLIACAIVAAILFWTAGITSSERSGVNIGHVN